MVGRNLSGVPKYDRQGLARTRDRTAKSSLPLTLFFHGDRIYIWTVGELLCIKACIGKSALPAMERVKTAMAANPETDKLAAEYAKAINDLIKETK